jgi:hypothetical protein
MHSLCRVKSIPQRPVLARSKWLRSCFEGCLFLQSYTAFAAAAIDPADSSSTQHSYSQPLFRQFFFVYLHRRYLLCVVLQLDDGTGYGVGGQPRRWNWQLMRPVPKTISE